MWQTNFSWYLGNNKRFRDIVFKCWAFYQYNTSKDLWQGYLVPYYDWNHLLCRYNLCVYYETFPVLKYTLKFSHLIERYSLVSIVSIFFCLEKLILVWKLVFLQFKSLNIHLSILYFRQYDQSQWSKVFGITNKTGPIWGFRIFAKRASWRTYAIS